MEAEAWGQAISITLQLAMVVITGLIVPWAKQIANSLNELKVSQIESNHKIERLNRRSRRHDREIANLKGLHLGGEQ